MADTGAKATSPAPKPTNVQGAQAAQAQSKTVPDSGGSAQVTSDVAEFLATMLKSAQSKTFRDYFAGIKIKKADGFPSLFSEKDGILIKVGAEDANA